ncbi:Snf11 protein [Maudiozyma humilis]|uniref:Snf11 protein n=1 Tax=Maudiozyma humilis TaxID=51915 RepID=A0AAV5RUW9_MAUHU|nr:Snf11 protein [Kazachstania humilis]
MNSNAGPGGVAAAGNPYVAAAQAAAHAAAQNGTVPAHVDPTTRVVSVEEQTQYKIQLLLHINSVLLARVVHMTNPFFKGREAAQQGQQGHPPLPEPVQQAVSQNLRRVHANLQCISQLNQGYARAKPVILDPPAVPQQQNQQQHGNDILAKLYLLMSRVFEFW